MCVLKLSFSVFTTAVSVFLILALPGCQNPDTSKESRLSVPLPEAISARSIVEQNDITARVEIPLLGISASLGVDKDRANGVWPELPSGQYTVNIIFETDLPGFGNIILAEASKEIDITPGGNTLSFYKSDYSYPDDDEDRYNNLVEINAGTDPLNGNSMPQPARVFVTSVSGTAKLSSWPDASGKSGLAAGDAICQARADTAGLGGRFVAWLSDRNHDAYCRVHGLSGKISEDCGQDALPESAGPWVRTDGYPFAPGISELTRSNVIYTSLPFNESGHQLFRDGEGGAPITIWTGTDQTGAWAEGLYLELPDSAIPWGDCNGWDSDATDLPGVAQGLRLATHRDWTTFAKGGSCSDTAGLACFELSKSVPLPDFAEPGKRVFMTSVVGTGDLSSWPDAGGKKGISAGDAICRARASIADLPNAEKFKAFLSDDTTTAIDRLISDGPWVRMDGVRIAKTKQDLIVNLGANGVAAGTFSSISVDEKGEYLSGIYVLVSVGTYGNGQSSTDNCLNWTSSDEETYGTVTQASFLGYMWLPPAPDSGGLACNIPTRLYCFEDD